MVMMLTGKPLPLAKANGRACTLPLFPRNVTSAYTDVSPAAIATSCAPWLIAASGSTAATARFVDVQVVDAKLPVQSSSGPVPGLSFSRLRSPTRSCATAWAPPQAGGQPCGRSTRSLPWKPSISHDETLGSAKVSQVKGGTVRMFLRSGLKPAARMQNVAAKHLAAVWRGILIGDPHTERFFPQHEPSRARVTLSIDGVSVRRTPGSAARAAPPCLRGPRQQHPLVRPPRSSPGHTASRHRHESAQCGIDGLGRWECGGDIRIEENDVRTLPEPLVILAADRASKVVLAEHVAVHGGSLNLLHASSFRLAWRAEHL
jgi:hypothetical protein